MSTYGMNHQTPDGSHGTPAQFDLHGCKSNMNKGFQWEQMYILLTFKSSLHKEQQTHMTALKLIYSYSQHIALYTLSMCNKSKRK